MALDAVSAQAYCVCKGEYMAKIDSAKTDTLFPILNQPGQARIGPLARLAQQAPLDSEGFLTEYRPLESRSLIGKVTSRRGVPFTHAINPYRGCEFACRYCYARYTHEFLEMHDPAEFERKIYFKQNAAWLLRQELRRLPQGAQIGIGSATDPYQPIERRQRIMRSIWEVFAEVGGYSLGLVTKSVLVLRDIELLQKVARKNRLSIHLTVTTMDTRLARLLEPRAPRPDLRIHALKRLRQAGIRAGVLCSPIMPGINDARSSMAAVARAAAEADANFFSAGALFLKPCSQPTFFAFVRQHYPALMRSYEMRYGRNAFASAEYRKRIAEIVDSISREFRLGRRYERMPMRTGLDFAAQRENPQSWLPFAQGA